MSEYTGSYELARTVAEQTLRLETQERLLRRHERIQKELLENLKLVSENLSKLSTTLTTMSDSSSVIEATALAPTFDRVWNFLSDRQLSLADTLDTLVNTDVSFSRLGDGEFKLMASPWRSLAFQPNSFELIDSLESILKEPTGNLLVGLPQFMRNSNYKAVWPLIWGHLEHLIPDGTSFGNAHVSRPLAFKFLGHDAVDAWRDVWRGKTVKIITGEGSRFDYVPNLFDSAQSLQRFDSVPIGAFSDIDRILSESIDEDTDLYLISLGPAGSVLAHRMAKVGCRALDIGHLSAAYLNAFEGRDVPERSPLVR